MKVRAISGHGGKAPACFLVEEAGSRILLDIGEGSRPGEFPDLSGVGPVDAVLVSHQHADHIGGLHLAAGLGAPPIFATEAVRNLGKGAALRAAQDLPLGGSAVIAGVLVETGRASHAPGGVWMRLGGPGGVLYTGDWTRESVLYPLDPPPPARLVICDASYGVHDEPLSTAFAALDELARQGPLLMPLPPTGRGLDIAVLLGEAGHRIRLCPAHLTVASYLLERGDGLLVDGARQRLATLMTHAEALDGRAWSGGVMLAGSGDGSSGVAAELIERFAPDGSAAIVFTGHVDGESNARSLIDAGRARFIRWNVHPRLRDLRWLFDAVRPQAVMPAFVDTAKIVALAAALPDIGFAGPELS